MRMSLQKEIGRLAEKGSVFAILAILVPVVGVLLPGITATLGVPESVNLFWGSLYGIGFEIVHQAYGYPEHRPDPALEALVGFIAWPLLLTFVTPLALRSAVLRAGEATRSLILTGFSMSLLIIAPETILHNDIAKDLPVFTKHLK